MMMTMLFWWRKKLMNKTKQNKKKSLRKWCFCFPENFYFSFFLFFHVFFLDDFRIDFLLLKLSLLLWKSKHQHWHNNLNNRIYEVEKKQQKHFTDTGRKYLSHDHLNNMKPNETPKTTLEYWIFVGWLQKKYGTESSSNESRKIQQLWW